MEFLDKSGLSKLWKKIKTHLNEKAPKSHAHTLTEVLGLNQKLNEKINKSSIQLCSTLSDAKAKVASGSYSSGTIFLVRKEA